mmetsp:Transcript_6013/g.9186  ORF Transcript_6013/g.9186 Transcript_6013/m.9186 type:complete len:227 (+) Transcript_6013:351-1031(+)
MKVLPDPMWWIKSVSILCVLFFACRRCVVVVVVVGMGFLHHASYYYPCLALEWIGRLCERDWGVDCRKRWTKERAKRSDKCDLATTLPGGSLPGRTWEGVRKQRRSAYSIIHPVRSMTFRSLATRKLPTSLPPDMILLARAAIQLEGLVLRAYPDYRLVDDILPVSAKACLAIDTNIFFPKTKQLIAVPCYSLICSMNRIVTTTVMKFTEVPRRQCHFHPSTFFDY